MSEIFAKEIRIEALKMVHRAKASHIGSALSITDIIAVLYDKILNIDPLNPNNKFRDRFILSKGHACISVYAALALKGFFPLEDLKGYGQDFSILMNHISHKVSGVEFSTGSLGHGLPFAVGKALAAKTNKQTWRTFVLLSDGELGEGSNWEACLFAAHHHLDNLIAIVDYNNLQSLTTIDKTLALEPLLDKFKSFGWGVREVSGHHHADLKIVFQELPLESTKPSIIIAKTLKGKGVSFMEGKVEWHYKSPNEAQLKSALKELSES
jgi:transketolase